MERLLFFCSDPGLAKNACYPALKTFDGGGLSYSSTLEYWLDACDERGLYLAIPTVAVATAHMQRGGSDCDLA